MRPKKTVLVLDGNADMLSLRKFLLETRGYRVLAASTPQEAVGLLRHWPAGTIAAMVAHLDFRPAFAYRWLRLLARSFPELRVVLQVGAAGDGDAPAELQAVVRRVIPYRNAPTSELLDAVRDAVARPRGPSKTVAAAPSQAVA